MFEEEVKRMDESGFETARQSFRDYYNDNSLLFHEAAAFFASLLTAVLRENGVEIDSVSARVKEREGCIDKFSRKYRDELEAKESTYAIKDWITDLIGVRIVCLYSPDVYTVEEVLKSGFAVIDETDKNKHLDAQDSQFGYKGVHLDLRLGSGRENLPEYKRYEPLQFEVQIRTITQDAWSTIDHKIKYKRNIPNSLRRRINRLAALFELADQEFLHIRNDAKEAMARGEQTLAKLKVESNTVEAKSQPIDVFAFQAALKREFPSYPVFEQKADLFLQEILQTAPDLSISEFSEALDTKLPAVYRYRMNVTFNMNPFTIIRHTLYSFNPNRFRPLLFPNQRGMFDAWLEREGNATATGMEVARVETSADH